MIKKLLKNHSLIRKMGEKAKTWAIKKFDSERLRGDLVTAISDSFFRFRKGISLGKVTSNNPSLWTKKLKNFFFTCFHSTGFYKIPFGSIELHFSKRKLNGERGTGRFSRDLLKELILLSKKEEVMDKPLKKIFFYTSLHGCPKRLRTPSVLILHDVIPLLLPEKFPPEILQKWKTHYKETSNQASHIVTISYSSATTIEKELGIPKEKISVVYNGVAKLSVNKNPTIPIPNKPYLLFLGSYDYHKNVEIVMKALTDHTLLDLDLVMIGNNKFYQQEALKLGIQQRVHFMGSVEDSDVGYFMKNALALVFPSLYEGFGSPPLEAALLGTPSICSRRPAMTELMKGVAFFADPHRVEEWVHSIQCIYQDPERRKTLGEEARLKAKQFSLQENAIQVLDVLKKIAR